MTNLSGDNDARTWLDRIRALPLKHRVRVMNVCGGHERTISKGGLRAVLPPKIELIPGPGCPVCVCPEEDICAAIGLALRHDVVLVAFGDMLRVPANLPKSEPRSLEQARGAGGRVVPIASPLEAVRIARSDPTRQVVFFAAGFETTMAPVAAIVAHGLPPNLSILLSGRRTWPAVQMLLDSQNAGFDALIAPGHVATIMGPEEWRFVADLHRLPVAVGGFEPQSLLAALYAVLHQLVDGRSELENCYGGVAHEGGNPTARKLLAEAFDVTDSNWRGIGVIAESGYVMRGMHISGDALVRFGIDRGEVRKRAGEMPPGCDCARVVLGKIYPHECALYGKACTPRHPIGPCMVSDEGACRIWWSSGVREARAHESEPTAG
ncbi:MAG: hydrogenase formation protein HypD [Alphaproteobacteria bacterium]|nr:hydrogenase formation protein HypD [Alphaproteobacteria bacterium]